MIYKENDIQYRVIYGYVILNLASFIATDNGYGAICSKMTLNLISSKER